jgi:hypothetical protein
MQQQHFQQEEPDPYVTKTVDLLSSRRKEIREEAERSLQEMGQEAVEELLLVLKKEAQRRKTRKKRIQASIACYLTLAVVIAVLFNSEFLLNSLGGMVGVILVAFIATQRQKNATRELAKYKDRRTVGPLAEALEFQDKDLAIQARARLFDLLPQLQASDAGLLNAEQRACLCRAVNREDIKLACAILKAFEQVGDGTALSMVEKLAAGEGRAARSPELQKAAEDCLLFLGPRVKNEKAHQQLLRAVDESDSAPDILLRPAAGAVETAPQELLRAYGAEPQTHTSVQELFLEDHPAAS